MKTHDKAPVALILAAGRGSRLGRGPKALLPWGESVLVVRAVKAAVTAGLRPLVVAGPQYRSISQYLEELDFPVEAIEVRDAAKGMSASWRAGIKAVGALSGVTPWTPIVIMLVDQPGIGSDVLRRIVSHFEPHRVLRAGWDRSPGHPVVMSFRHAQQAAHVSSGDEAGRAWLRDHAGLVDVLECGDIGAGHDIDTEQDLLQWKQS